MNNAVNSNTINFPIMNIEKHILYWKNGAEEDWEVANKLIESDKIRHGLFFLHLTLEKILKAHVC